MKPHSTLLPTKSKRLLVGDRIEVNDVWLEVTSGRIARLLTPLLPHSFLHLRTYGIKLNRPLSNWREVARIIDGAN